jgi:hypothetical protein
MTAVYIALGVLAWLFLLLLCLGLAQSAACSDVALSRAVAERLRRHARKAA